MLLKTTHLATSLAPFTHLKRCPYSFSKATQSPITPAIINPNLLYRVSQEQTLRALEFTMEQNNFLYKLDPKDLIVFDKISETLDSKTHRVFDLYQKKFFAVKTLSLESETAWKHLNIALRRYHEGSTPLATIRSFDYDKSAKKVHIVSDIGRTIVSDYAIFKKQNDIPWTKLELRALTWQLIAQMYAFKKIGVECNYLKPEHMFVSHDGKSIELYDYPGFELESKLVHRLRTRLDMNIVLMTLVHIIDPGAPVGCVSEAKSYLKTYFPEFLSEFERMKFDLNVSAFLTGDLTKKIKHEVYKSMPIENVILDRRYELHNTERLKKILESKDLPRFEENRGLIAQGLFQTREAISIFENMREKSNKYGQTQEDSARAHLHLGEIYQNTNPDKALEHFSKAASISCCLPQMDNALKARIFNEYGKTLWDKDQTKEALYCFKEVQKILRNATDVPSRLREEIKANLSYFEKNCEPDGVSCEVNEFSLGVKLYFLFMGVAIVNFGFWAYWNRNPEPEVNKTSSLAEKNPKPTRKISEVSKKVAPKLNIDNQAQQKEKDQALIAQEKRQKRINWALFGLSLMVSTAMIAI